MGSSLQTGRRNVGKQQIDEMRQQMKDTESFVVSKDGHTMVGTRPTRDKLERDNRKLREYLGQMVTRLKHFGHQVAPEIQKAAKDEG